MTFATILMANSPHVLAKNISRVVSEVNPLATDTFSKEAESSLVDSWKIFYLGKLLPLPLNPISALISSICSVLELMRDDFDMERRSHNWFLLNFKKYIDAHKFLYWEPFIIYKSLFPFSKWEAQCRYEDFIPEMFYCWMGFKFMTCPLIIWMRKWIQICWRRRKIHGVPLLSKKNFVIVGDFAKPLPPLMIRQNAAGIQVGGKFKYEKLWTFLL